MNNNLTELVLIVDRSGSMYNMAKEANISIQKLFEEQRKEEGECRVTLIQFDSAVDVVYNNTPVEDVDSFNLEPRYSTALLDAVGQTIDMVGQRLSQTYEEDRPGLVNVCILTDGYENASSRYSKQKIKSMIEHQQEKYNWKFTYLGANQNSFLEAKKYGLDMAGVSNYTSMSGAVEGFSGKVKRMRKMSAEGAEVDNSFTQEEITSMNT